MRQSLSTRPPWLWSVDGVRAELRVKPERGAKGAAWLGDCLEGGGLIWGSCSGAGAEAGAEEGE